MNRYNVIIGGLSLILFATGCNKNKTESTIQLITPAMTEAFGSNIDLNNLPNYNENSIPGYIRKDNSMEKPSNAIITLGRVLFYDKHLSIDNTISCASCHQQKYAFSDPMVSSDGVSGGKTGRHSMRLINERFSAESKFFWDERAATLEEQTTKPIQDHAEMGYSGQLGRPNLQALIDKLQAIEYYRELFSFTFGDETITEERIQKCLAQFIRSIQSFDSRYDIGRNSVQNDNQNFPNFSDIENQGKNLFLTPPQFNGQGVRISGGAGCNGCHKAPEFDIDPNSRNNGVIGVINGSGSDLLNTRSPSLRNLINPSGELNTPLMHTGQFNSLEEVINHYNHMDGNNSNTNLDPRLRPNGFGQQLNLTNQEVEQLLAFLNTLSGSEVYTDPKWANPFK